MNSFQILKSSKKCEHCEKWTDGTKAFCAHCGEMLDMQYRKEQHEWAESQKSQTPMMKLISLHNSTSNPFYFLVEKLIQGGQLILMGIITFVTFLLLLLPA